MKKGNSNLFKKNSESNEMDIGIQNMIKVSSYNPSSPVNVIETIPNFQSPQPCISPSSLINACKDNNNNEEQEGFSAPTKMRF